MEGNPLSFLYVSRKMYECGECLSGIVKIVANLVGPSGIIWV